MDNYRVMKIIGHGTISVCMKIKRKSDGKVLVWKEIDYSRMTKTEEAKLNSEVKLLRELNHPNIVKYYDDFRDTSTRTLYIVMEYCDAGDLAGYIKKREGRNIEEPFIWKVANQIIMAVEYCHNRSRNGKATTHRDIKPANVFLTSNGYVKLSAFDGSRLFNSDNNLPATALYMSPELIAGESHNEKADVWSVGCLLYEISTLRPPFSALDCSKLVDKICCGKFAKIPKNYSVDLENVISLILEVNVAKRPTMNMLLNHAILKRHRH